MTVSGDENQENPRQVNRRTILKAFSATSVTTISGQAMAQSTGDTHYGEAPRSKKHRNLQGLLKKYENHTNVNRVIRKHDDFIKKLFSVCNITKSINELMVDDVSPPTETDSEGILVRSERTADKNTIKLNIVRNTSVGPINIALYPESVTEPYATLTIEERSEIDIYRPEIKEATDSVTFNVTSDTYNESISIQSSSIPSWACQTCPTDTTCCRCKRECINDCCLQRCTPVYDYYCDCCRYSRASCWSDCY